MNLAFTTKGIAIIATHANDSKGARQIARILHKIVSGLTNWYFSIS